MRSPRFRRAIVMKLSPFLYGPGLHRFCYATNGGSKHNSFRKVKTVILEWKELLVSSRAYPDFFSF